MSSRYWVGNGGSWSDTAHWSTISGGSGGASVPGGTTDVVIDSNSFNTTGQTITVSSSAFCQHLSVSTTQAPTIALSSLLTVNGNLTLNNAITVTSVNSAAPLLVYSTAGGTQTIKTSGSAIQRLTLRNGSFPSGATAIFSLTDALSVSVLLNVISDTFTFGGPITLTTSGNSITAQDLFFASQNGTLSVDSSTITVSGTFYVVPAATMTCDGTTWVLGSGSTASLDGSSSSLSISGASSSSRATITNNSGSTQTISNSTLTNTVLNGSNGFRLVEIVDGGGNDWGGGGGGGPGVPARLYHVKVPPDHIQLP